METESIFKKKEGMLIAQNRKKLEPIRKLYFKIKHNLKTLYKQI